MSDENNKIIPDEKGRRDFLKGLGSVAVGGAVLAASAMVIPPSFAGDKAEEKQKNSEKPFLGQTAIVTGAARGIGRTTALKLAKLGANIVLIDIAKPDEFANKLDYKLSSPEDLHNTEVAVQGEGVLVLSIVADVRNFDQIQTAVSQAVEKFGGVDIVIANAGISTNSSFVAQNPEVFNDVMDVNVSGVANIIRATLPHLKKSKFGGRIVNLASMAGRMGVPMMSAYAASKWAVIGLTKSLALELGPENITVNAVAPTGVKTKLTLRNNMIDAGTDALFKAMNSLPVGLIEPEEVSDVIAFLVSKEARHISGAVFDISAGMSGRTTG